MSLPIVALKSEEKWDCHQCGFCCRGTLIPLSRLDAERLQSQGWESEPEFRNQIITVVDRTAESGTRLAQRADGTCVFLKEDGLCRIHSKFGIEAKPIVCQTFPFQLIARENQAIMTLHRACPSAAADRGQPTSVQLPLIKQLVRSGKLHLQATSPPALKAKEFRDWKTIGKVLESVGGLLQDQRFPPVRRLVHALQFANLLQAAKTQRLNNEQIVELAQTLAELAPEESKPFFAEREPPKRYAKVLFRLAAVNFARLHPESQHRPSWASRWELIHVALKAVRGVGVTPKLGGFYPRVPIEELEAPLGVLPPEVYLPLNRFIETSAESQMYALANRQGWSIVDSVRHLALSFPVALWMLRWIARGQAPSDRDMLHIVCALDRSQGYGPLTANNHRSRLAMLATNGELERLVVWYAR